MTKNTLKLPKIKQRMSLVNGWKTEVVIDVSRSLLWQQVTNFADYKQWNPFVIEAYAPEFKVRKKLNF